jgi:hypothetical protein
MRLGSSLKMNTAEEEIVAGSLSGAVRQWAVGSGQWLDVAVQR